MIIPPLSTLCYQSLIRSLAEGHKSFQNILDEEGLRDFIHEASKRRLLTDTFLVSLCGSGVPPRYLELGKREYDVRDILKQVSFDDQSDELGS